MWSTIIWVTLGKARDRIGTREMKEGNNARIGLEKKS